MDVTGGEQLAQNLLQVNELFVFDPNTVVLYSAYSYLGVCDSRRNIVYFS